MSEEEERSGDLEESNAANSSVVACRQGSVSGMCYDCFRHNNGLSFVVC